VADFNKQATGLDIIRAATAQLALPVPIAAASAPNDVTARQMLALLNYAGRRLIKPTNGYRWQALRRTWQLTTNATDTQYDMPPDWDSFTDMTAWNFSSRLPMLGPATDQQWMTLKARNLGSSTISVVYRTRGNKFEIYNTFTNPQDLRIDYASRAWVQDGVDPLRFKDYVETDSDLVLYDSDLITAALKLRFMVSKGFDTTAMQADYDDALNAAISADTDAPVLTLNQHSSYPLISTQFNAPDTGFGV
jgi:hypothetical protein